MNSNQKPASLDALLFVISILFFTSCDRQEPPTVNQTEPAMIQPLHNENEEMNNGRLDALIRVIDADAAGQPGAWQFQSGGRTLICFTDESANRMRIMTPIGDVDATDSEEMARCLAANFDRALDARYCISGNQLWSAFLHPLGSLDEELFQQAVHQVSTLADNHGSTYSSSDLIFGSE